MISKFARLKFELFTKPSNLDFLRAHQTYPKIAQFERIMFISANPLKTLYVEGITCLTHKPHFLIIPLYGEIFIYSKDVKGLT
jgi:hypothetical protein